MDNYSGIAYVKRTQKDYSLSFKLQVVGEVECGEVNGKTRASMKKMRKLTVIASFYA